MAEDPSGEEEVCVGNCDIHFVESMPAYYDGALQVLERDPECKHYNIIGAKYKRSGRKIQIHVMSITDAISNADGKDFSVDYSELSEDRIETTKKAHDDLKLWHKNLTNKIESDQFVAWVIEKLNIEDQEEAKLVAQRFFEQNFSASDPLPENCDKRMSYLSIRKMQWETKCDPVVEDGFVKIFKI